LRVNLVSQGIQSTQLSMRIIEASSVGCIAFSRLRRQREGIIQGVYRTAINILFDGELVSLVSEEIQRGPLNITLKLPLGLRNMSSLGVKVGEKARINGFTLILGDYNLISFDSARIYSPKQICTNSILANNEIEANVEVMRRTAVLFGKMAGLGELLSSINSEKKRRKIKDLNIFSSFAFPRLLRLEKAFQSERRIALNNAVRELMGIGPGLTPSSDDMLAGLVLMCVIYAKNSERASRSCKFTAQAIMNEVQGRTTLLSEEYLKQASCGRGNEPVMLLCAALLTERHQEVERETMRVLKIGETSGTDTILGIALGTMFCMGKRTFFGIEEFLNEH
jgi:hypothetical protein